MDFASIHSMSFLMLSGVTPRNLWPRSSEERSVGMRHQMGPLNMAFEKDCARTHTHSHTSAPAPPPGHHLGLRSKNMFRFCFIVRLPLQCNCKLLFLTAFGTFLGVHESGDLLCRVVCSKRVEKGACSGDP